MKKFFIGCLAATVLCVSLAGCTTQDDGKSKVEPNPAIGKGQIEDLMGEQPGEGVLASVNGESITQEDIDKVLPVLRYIYQKNPTDSDWDSFMSYAIQYYTSSKVYDLKMEELGLSVDEEKLQEAYDNIVNATENPEEFYAEIEQFEVNEEQIREFLRSEQVYNTLYDYVTKDVSVTDEEIQEYYDTNAEGFTNVTSRDFYQILYENTEDAQKDLDWIMAGEKSFDEVAEEQNVENGGYMATVVKGELIAPFEDIVWELTENEVYGEVVESDVGFHIVTTKNLVENKTYTVEELTENIEAYLIQDKKTSTMNDFVNDCVIQYSVSVYDTTDSTEGTDVENPVSTPNIKVTGD